MGKVIWVEAEEIRKPRSEAERRAMRQRMAIRRLYDELADVLGVAIARGEELGYADDDYRKRLGQLRRDGGDESDAIRYAKPTKPEETNDSG